MITNNRNFLNYDRIQEITRRFRFIPNATAEQVLVYKEIREEAESFALFLARNCPESREFSLALTALEDATMWAINSIARNE